MSAEHGRRPSRSGKLSLRRFGERSLESFVFYNSAPIGQSFVQLRKALSGPAVGRQASRRVNSTRERKRKPLTQPAQLLGQEQAARRLAPEDLAQLVMAPRAGSPRKKAVPATHKRRAASNNNFYRGRLGVGETTMENSGSSRSGQVGPESPVGVSAQLGSSTSAQHVVMQLPGRAHHIAASRCKIVFDQSPRVARWCCAFVEDRAQPASSRPPGAAGCIRSRQRSGHRLMMASDSVGPDDAAAPSPGVSGGKCSASARQASGSRRRAVQRSASSATAAARSPSSIGPGPGEGCRVL